jgi:hypothetical protein
LTFSTFFVEPAIVPNTGFGRLKFSGTTGLAVQAAECFNPFVSYGSAFQPNP